MTDEADERKAASVDEARGWHREMFGGVPLPEPEYAGEVRNEDPRHPALVGYEVRVGPRPGVPAHRVHEALERFEDHVRRATSLIDPIVPAGQPPADRDSLGGVVTLTAFAHGEWVRIHPFANGNGRVARLWAHWAALRYGLPPFVRLSPRPEGLAYARASADSMDGDHRAMTSWLAARLEARMKRGR